MSLSLPAVQSVERERVGIRSDDDDSQDYDADGIVKRQNTSASRRLRRCCTQRRLRGLLCSSAAPASALWNN